MKNSARLCLAVMALIGFTTASLAADTRAAIEAANAKFSGLRKRLFGTGTVPVALKQVESVTTANGATYHRFERGGKPTYGQMGA